MIDIDNPSLNQILTIMAADNKLDFRTMSERNQKVLQDMMICHTEICGFTKEVCEHCGHTTIHYGSCNNTCCVQCGAARREEWAKKQQEKKVDAPYYHIVFTVPDKYLNELFLYDPEYMYKAILKATAETLKKMSKDPHYLGAEKSGFITLLHTWGSNMSLHCHTHTIFCAAGLDKEGNFVCGNDKFLFPVEPLAIMFQNKFLKIVSKKYEYSGSPFLQNIQNARSAQWNVEIKNCDGGPDHVIEYAARYINRPAISNGRLVSYKNGVVRFKYKDYKAGGKIKEMELEDTEFVRRFLMHIPPKGFSRCRNYGFMGNNSSKTLKTIQELAAKRAEEKAKSEEVKEGPVTRAADEIKGNSAPGQIITEAANSSAEDKVWRCPKCGCTSKKITVAERVHDGWTKWNLLLERIVELKMKESEYS